MVFDVVKKTGEQETYNSQKLCTSIERAGVNSEQAQRICVEVEKNLKPGASTTKIFRETLRQLVKEDIEISARYTLRRAIDDLGPTGFLFEQFVEALLQAHGYTTERGIMMQGECVEHEVDVFAHKGSLTYIVEAKYRNEHNIKTHIDQVMYADARLMDIQRRVSAEEVSSQAKEKYIMWVITNTKFTEKAIQYATCRDIKLVGWNYPKKENLEDMITSKKMYPITVLPSLTRSARDQFAQHNMILAQDILPYSEEDLKRKFQISPSIAKKLQREAQALIN